MPSDFPINRVRPEPSPLSMSVIMAGDGIAEVEGDAPNTVQDFFILDARTAASLTLRAITEMNLQEQPTPPGSVVPEPWEHEISEITNLIKNATFNEGLDHWETIGGAPLVEDGILKLTQDHPVYDGVEQHFDMQPGARTITLTFRIASPGGGGSFFVGFSNGETFIHTYTYSTPSVEWRTLTLDTDGHGDYDGIRLQASGTTPGAKSWIDSIFLGQSLGTSRFAFRIPPIPYNQGEIHELDAGNRYGPLQGRRDYGRVKLGLTGNTVEIGATGALIRRDPAHNARATLTVPEGVENAINPGIAIDVTPVPIIETAVPSAALVPCAMGVNATWFFRNTAETPVRIEMVPILRQGDRYRIWGSDHGVLEMPERVSHLVTIPAAVDGVDAEVLFHIPRGVMDSTSTPLEEGAPLNLIRDPLMTRGASYWGQGTVAPEPGLADLRYGNEARIGQTLAAYIGDFTGYTVSLRFLKAGRCRVRAVWHTLETEPAGAGEILATLESLDGPGVVEAECAAVAAPPGNWNRVTLFLENPTLSQRYRVARVVDFQLWDTLAKQYEYGALVFPDGAPAAGTLYVARLDALV